MGRDGLALVAHRARRDHAGTTLLVASETGLVPGLVVPGFPYGLIRID